MKDGKLQELLGGKSKLANLFKTNQEHAVSQRYHGNIYVTTTTE